MMRVSVVMRVPAMIMMIVSMKMRVACHLDRHCSSYCTRAG
jgi:hypothetical protein